MKNIFTLCIILCLSLCQASHAQILYQISGNGLDKPSYIFGTHHLAPLSIIDSVHAKKYLNQADQVVGEIDMTKGQLALGLAMQPHLATHPDSTLSKLLGEEKMNHYNTIFKQIVQIPGVELKVFDSMKPMVANAMLTLALVQKELPGFKPDEQLDTYFQNYATQNNKKVIPLETPEMQAAFLYDSVTIADQMKALISTLDNPEEATATARTLNQTYLQQDLDKLLQLSLQDNDNPRFMQTILFHRNDAWMKKLPQIIQSAPTFIAVGALHLPGDKGLLQQLRNQGFTIIPLP